MKNALTFDLEEYFQVSAFENQVERAAWDACSSRVGQTTERLLDLLDQHQCKATFFTLGWLAQKYPKLIRGIAERGHEIACHSLEHRTVYRMTPNEFREDTQRAKQLLEDASGVSVRGYRAPSFSITNDSLWALDCLADLGFIYDSSIFPVRHPNYGIPDAPRDPFVVRTRHGDVVEFPMPTLAIGNRRAPLAGGAYLRFLPYWYSRWGIQYLNKQENRPICVYLHPWELDADQPQMNVKPTARLRHYLGLRGVEVKLRRLLGDFEFEPLISLITQAPVPQHVVDLQP